MKINSDYSRKLLWAKQNVVYKILVISLTINLSVFLYFIAKKLHYSAPRIFKAAETTKSVIDDSIVTTTINLCQLKEARRQLFHMLPINKDDIVFIGSSLTSDFPLEEMFKNINIKNRGIAGGTTEDVLKIIPAVSNKKPKKIFIEIGVNDIGKNISIDTIAGNLSKICSVAKTLSPKSGIYVHAVLPTSGDRMRLNPLINEYNKKINDYCVLNNVTYINLHPLFVNNGCLSSALTFDGLHLNGPGYFLWKNEIEKYIKE